MLTASADCNKRIQERFHSVPIMQCCKCASTRVLSLHVLSLSLSSAPFRLQLKARLQKKGISKTGRLRGKSRNPVPTSWQSLAEQLVPPMRSVAVSDASYSTPVLLFPFRLEQALYIRLYDSSLSAQSMNTTFATSDCDTGSSSR